MKEKEEEYKTGYIAKYLDIIPNIDSPLKFFSYVVASIVITGISAFNAPENLTLIIVLLAIILIVLIYAFVFHIKVANVPKAIFKRQKSNGSPLNDISINEFKNLFEITNQNAKFIKQNEKYDLYVACPMDSSTKDERHETKKCLLELVEIIRKVYNYHEIESPASIQTKPITTIGSDHETFDMPQKAFMLCYSRILFSKRFLFILPKLVPTSALFELGLAMAFGKPITIITPKRKELPFLLREINQLPVHTSIYEYNGKISDIINKIHNKEIKIEEVYA